MTKVITAVRTLFLVFIVGYTIHALPLSLLLSSSARKGNVTVDLSVLWQVTDVLKLAIAFIAVETVLGWIAVWVDGKKKALAERRAEAAQQASASSAGTPVNPNQAEGRK
jgi:hypothetical protein